MSVMSEIAMEVGSLTQDEIDELLYRMSLAGNESRQLHYLGSCGLSYAISLILVEELKANPRLMKMPEPDL